MYMLAYTCSVVTVKEMVHWNVENGQITPLQIAENINKNEQSTFEALTGVRNKLNAILLPFPEPTH